MARDRVFLFLQGPHGPFFAGLAALLRAAGCETWRVGFNTGDRVFWHPSDRYIPYRGPADTWPDKLAAILGEKGATDLVLYGDTRPVHAGAIRLAEARGLTVHVFEEGYLRPYWTTYERGGSNGHSRLMGMSVADMRGRWHGPKPTRRRRRPAGARCGSTSSMARSTTGSFWS